MKDKTAEIIVGKEAVLLQKEITRQIKRRI